MTKCMTQWPARPGEEQYEWEEPRVTEAQSKLGGESHAGQRHDRVDAIANEWIASALGEWSCPPNRRTSMAYFMERNG